MPGRELADRVPCQVIGCGRTIAALKIKPDGEWICADHWALVDPAIKRLKLRAKRRAKRLGRWTYTNAVLARGIWARCKKQAIERALGITA